MQLSFVVLLSTAILSVFAAPHARRQVNLNQGSARLITQDADGTFVVDGIHFDDSSVAAQVACALDERDCLNGGSSSQTCKSQKIDCQSGNGINGQTALLNNESP